MSDALYWIIRVLLAGGWCVCACRAWTRREEWPRIWVCCAVLSVLFASLRAYSWNYDVLAAARSALGASGFYEDRAYWKAILALGLVAVIVVGLRRRKLLARHRNVRMCIIGLSLQAALLAVETLSLDDAMPQIILKQPGRYLLEAAFLGLVTRACFGSGVPDDRSHSA